ncbi:MAG: hypothetical protein U0175_20090 [Caldilineaceae bacterium]
MLTFTIMKVWDALWLSCQTDLLAFDMGWLFLCMHFFARTLETLAYQSVR